MVVTLDPINKGSGVVLSNGNITARIPDSYNTARATLGKTTGKWYWEVSFSAFSDAMVSVIGASAGVARTYDNANSRAYYSVNGNKWHTSATAYGATYGLADTIGVALDMDSGSLTYYKNGISQGVAFTNLKTLGEVFPAITSGASGAGSTAVFNFGAIPFKHVIPEGYLAYGTTLHESALLSKDGKGYSTDIINTWYETRMTSNTAPAPLVASASTTQSATYAQWKAFDGIILPLDNQSSWSATSTQRSGWLQLDYGRQMLINKMSLTILEFTTSPKDFQVLGSNDNANWNVLLDVKNEVWQTVGSNETKEYKFVEDANYRYYRINITTVSAPNKQPMITELKYGYDRLEMTQITPITADSFVEYGKSEFNSLDYELDRFKYVLASTIKEKKLDRKPLSIRLS